MVNSKPFLDQTAETASFAFREYFRPLIEAVRFLKATFGPPAPPTSAPEPQTTLDDSKAVLPTKAKNPL
jgi:hypothetical protein